jgi:hypothetical protein
MEAEKSESFCRRVYLDEKQINKRLRNWNSRLMKNKIPKRNSQTFVVRWVLEDSKSRRKSFEAILLRADRSRTWHKVHGRHLSDRRT